MPIAPRTFYAWVKRAPSKRALWDATITEILAGYYEPDDDGRRKPESLYGSVKMWAHLQRQGIPVAKSTVERLMRRQRLAGRAPAEVGAHHDRRPGRRSGTGPGGSPVPGAHAQSLLVVADFTYVKLVTGVFVYVAFVIDAYAGAIIGWEAASVQADPVRGVRDPSSRCTARPPRPSGSTAPSTTRMPDRRADSTGRRNTVS